MLTPEATEQLEVHFSTLSLRAYEKWGFEPTRDRWDGYRPKDLRNRHKKGRKVAQARTWIAQELRRTVWQSVDGKNIFFRNDVAIVGSTGGVLPVYKPIAVKLSYPNIALVMRCWTKKVKGKVRPIHTSALLACKRKVEVPNGLG